MAGGQELPEIRSNTTLDGGKPLDPRVLSRLRLEELAELWPQCGDGWRAVGPFIHPAWLSTWWDCFSQGAELMVLADLAKSPMSVAPLCKNGDELRFIGSTDLSDRLDILAGHNEHSGFAEQLLQAAAAAGCRRLLLLPVSEESWVLRQLARLARELGCQVEVSPQVVSVRMALPDTWEKYLDLLTGKQRHEVRRKFRRVEEAGNLTFRVVREPAEVPAAMDLFVTQFRASRRDKGAFLTPERERFFRELAANLAAADMLRLFQVSLDAIAAASVFCIDDGQALYLYNNGFAPQFSPLSMGVVSKLITIRQAIRWGRSGYDFLNGAESYKGHLGGKQHQLYRCSIVLP